MSDSAPCMWMRGGTSKGGFFVASDLPQTTEARDAFLLRAMGSPDLRQIDGMGGADPLTSKVAIVSPSSRDGVDIDYLFLQVMVDRALVSDAQNCGNMLAAVGAFAIERGLVKASHIETNVTLYMQNTGQIATQLIQTPDAQVCYSGEVRIDGVPGTASPIPITFRDTAGSSCGSLLPTGNQVDIFDDIQLTCIDNGMPSIIIRAEDMGITGLETRAELDANNTLKHKLESIRLQAGPLMNLGDVKDKTVPKMCLVSAAQNGGAISTRSFIPHRCHASIGVLAAVTVATACMLPNSPAHALAKLPVGNSKQLKIEHPVGETTVVLELNDAMDVESAAILRTARKLFDGTIFV